MRGLQSLSSSRIEVAIATSSAGASAVPRESKTWARPVILTAPSSEVLKFVTPKRKKASSPTISFEPPIESPSSNCETIGFAVCKGGPDGAGAAGRALCFWAIANGRNTIAKADAAPSVFTT